MIVVKIGKPLRVGKNAQALFNESLFHNPVASRKG
jgi:hypothetical protein